MPFTAKEAAAKFHISTRTVQRWAKSGRLNTTRDATGQVLYSEPSVTIDGTRITPETPEIAAINATLKALPPVGGQWVVPNVQQYVGLVQTISKFYQTPDEALRDSRVNARTMLRNLVIREPLQARMLATAELPWHIEPEDKRDRVQLRQAETIQRIIESIPDFLKYRYSLLWAIWFGRSGVQNRYIWDFSSGQKRLKVKEWSPVHGDSLVYKWDSDDVAVYTGMYNGFDGTREVTTEPAWLSRAHTLTDSRDYKKLSLSERQAFVIHAHDLMPGDFLTPEDAGGVKGVGIRSVVYWTWRILQEVSGWLIEFLERVGTGITIWRYTRGNEESYKAVKQIAESQSSQAAVLFPVDPALGHNAEDVQRIEPNAVGIDNMMRVLDQYYGSQVRRYIVGQDATSQSTPHGLSERDLTAENTFNRIVRYDAINLQETLTRDLVSVIKEWTFPDSNYECRFVINIDRPDPKEFLDADKTFHELGGALDEDELRGIIGLSKPSDDSAVLQSAQAKDAVAAKKDQAEGANEQAETAATGELAQTVGGLQAIAALQSSYYEGKIPQDACVANVVLLFGFSEEQARSLFPEIPPEKLTEEPGPGGPPPEGPPPGGGGPPPEEPPPQVDEFGEPAGPEPFAKDNSDKMRKAADLIADRLAKASDPDQWELLFSVALDETHDITRAADMADACLEGQARPFRFEGTTWAPYQGPKGGRGWKSSTTGEVVYGDRPGGDDKKTTTERSLKDEGRRSAERQRHDVVKAVKDVGSLGAKVARKGLGVPKQILSSILAPVPQAIKAPVANLLHGAHEVLMVSAKAANAWADQAASDKGLDDTKRKSLARVLGAIDLTFQWGMTAAGFGSYALDTLGIASTPHEVSLVLKGCAYIPVASIGYLLFSGAKNPKGTIKSAVNAIKGKFPKFVGNAAMGLWNGFRHPATYLGHTAQHAMRLARWAFARVGDPELDLLAVLEVMASDASPEIKSEAIDHLGLKYRAQFAEVGRPFQGPSGRWFVVKDVGGGKTRTVPSKNPNAEPKAKAPAKPRQPKTAAPKEAAPKAADVMSDIQAALKKGVTGEDVARIATSLGKLKQTDINAIKKQLAIKVGGKKEAQARHIAEKALAAAKQAQPEKPQPQVDKPQPKEEKPTPQPEKKPEPQPEKPKAEAPKVGFDPSLTEHGKQAMTNAAKGIQRNKELTSEQRRHYWDATQRVVKNMPAKAQERLAKVKFHYSTSIDKVVDDVIAAFPERHRQTARDKLGGSQAAGMYSTYHDGVFFDGGREGRQGELARQQGRAVHAHEIYAHEMAHSLDGPNLEHSKSAEWQAAWKAELTGNRLTKYAAKDLQEGWAEFGRLLYSGEHDLAQVKAQYPRCWAVYERHGFAPQMAKARQAKGALHMEDIFGEKVEIGRDHVDVLGGPTRQRYEWQPGDHPRGQPDNPGQFAPGGGAQAARKKGGGKPPVKKGSPRKKKEAPKEEAAAPPAEPPKGPPKPPGGGGSEEEHHQRVKELHEGIDKALDEAAITPARKREFGQTAKDNLGKMTREAVQRLHANVKEWKFYQTHDSLTKAFREKYPDAEVGLLKGCYDKDGTLHLNGGGRLFDREAPLSEFYAHEMTHAVDGLDHHVSGSDAWGKAWNAEKAFLNENGQSKRSEGLAEFGQMVVGTDITRDDVREVMPRCLKVWEANGL